MFITDIKRNTGTTIGHVGLAFIAEMARISGLDRLVDRLSPAQMPQIKEHEIFRTLAVPRGNFPGKNTTKKMVALILAPTKFGMQRNGPKQTEPKKSKNPCFPWIMGSRGLAWNLRWRRGWDLNPRMDY